MADVKLRQVRSSNGASPKQRGTLESLKLGKIGRESTLADSHNRPRAGTLGSARCSRSRVVAKSSSTANGCADSRESHPSELR